MTNVTIPYKPRKHQGQLHRKIKRFNVLPCHRRFGKSYWGLAETLKKAFQNTLPNPRYYIISATYSQVKKIHWDNLKLLTKNIPYTTYHETELRCDMVGGRRIQLLGADGSSVDSIRGIYADGVILDECQLLHKDLITKVLRPALVDRHQLDKKTGWLIAIGTPSGHNFFYDMYMNNKGKKDWFVKKYTVEDTKIIPKDELENLKLMMSPEEYATEFLCDFDAGVVNGIYSKSMQLVEDEKRITTVPHIPELPVTTFSDIGFRDAFSIVFVQKQGSAIHIIDHLESAGESIEFYANKLKELPYTYDNHFAGHDIVVKELGTGKSRQEIASNLGWFIQAVPKLKVEEGINALRMVLKRCYFEKEKCDYLINCLKQYRWKTNQLGEITSTPHHGTESNSCDAMRYMAIGLNESSSWSSDLKYGPSGIV